MLADAFDVFLLDVDGVVRVGADILPGARAAVDRLRNLGKTIRFVTNDPRPRRSEVFGELAAEGMAGSPAEVCTVGWTTGKVLKRLAVRSALVLGTAGLLADIAAACPDLRVNDGGPYDVVVMGYADTITARQLDEAAGWIAQGARFLATNTDPSFPTQKGRALGTGAVVAALQAATGQRPVVVGKPSPPLFEEATRGLDPRARVVVIGDSPATDVAGAHRMGYAAVLVADQPPTFAVAEDPRRPEATIRSLEDLFRPGTLTPRPRLGFPWPEAILPGVAAVVFDAQGRVLLVQRRDTGQWGLPSGHVEAGETVAAAVVREVAEETGLAVDIDRLVGVYSDPPSQVFAYPSGPVVHFVTCCFACRVRGGALRPDERETTAVGFFEITRLPENLLPMHPRWLADALTTTPTVWVR
ncbi:MAG: NUDIX domain-containing protein [Actinomycetia bacterium]|nr:NUDIX domain-containing protein [Actinomycetes bacterium]